MSNQECSRERFSNEQTSLEFGIPLVVATVKLNFPKTAFEMVPVTLII